MTTNKVGNYPCCDGVVVLCSTPGDPETFVGGYCNKHGFTVSRKLTSFRVIRDDVVVCSPQREDSGYPVFPRSVIQPWVQDLGLRHQGVLLTAVRGCDTAPKDDSSKRFIRVYRAMILEPFCGDAWKATSFIEMTSPDECRDRFNVFRRNCDHYPHHYIMHLVHSIEIIGYKHPRIDWRNVWNYFYMNMVSALHLNLETEEEMDMRLTAPESAFGRRDYSCDGSMKKGD